MPPRYAILREGREVGALYDLPAHGQVCLHTDDSEVARLLETEGLLASPRSPYLDAAQGGVHGGYRPRVQINLFFEPPIEALAEAIAGALSENGYTVAQVQGR